MQEEDYAVLRSRGVEQLMASKEMKALRVAAQHKRLDLSDAFESSAGRGVNALIGEMPRNRFCSTLGGLFGGELKEDVLKAICAVYGCGDPDPVWGGYQEVWFKQFAVDFDKIEWRNKKAVGGANGISDGVGGMQEDELLLLQAPLGDSSLRVLQAGESGLRHTLDLLGARSGLTPESLQQEDAQVEDASRVTGAEGLRDRQVGERRREEPGDLHAPGKSVPEIDGGDQDRGLEGVADGEGEDRLAERRGVAQSQDVEERLAALEAIAGRREL